jgi:hypothetical protein
MNPLPYPLLFDSYAPEQPGEATAVDRVLEHFTRPDPWEYDYLKLRELQLEAFNERLAERRHQIPVVGQRAEQLSVDEVGSADDVLPLLFSPTVYKAYPESFVSKGKWSSLLRWLDGVSSVRLASEVEVEGVQNIDEFIERLKSSGCPVVTTSGTSGKVSLMPENQLDAERAAEMWSRTFGSMWGIQPSERHPFFYTGHRRGAYRGTYHVATFERAFSTPETMYALFEETLLVGEVSRMAALSKGLANGTATPSEISEVRANQERAQVRSAEAIDRFVDRLELHPDEPVFLWGQAFAFYTIMKRAKERKANVRFHPDGGIITAGGLKNNRLPDGDQDELRAFYDVKMTSGYGQSEVIGPYVECSAGAWHLPPTVLLLLTDPTGERALWPTEGTAEGVVASFDFSAAGRWGGVISSDWVTANFSPCSCGRTSPSILSCRRFDANAGQDDKLNCQGRIEMYIRGALDEPAS